MLVCLTYNLKEKDDTKPPDYFSEFDTPETINAIVNALKIKGYKVETLNVNEHEPYLYFKKHHVDVVFNIAEGKGGKFRESEVPAILETLAIPYTGSDAICLALALDKTLTKKILISEGIPTPKFQLFKSGREKLNPFLKFPLIVKPNREGSAKGLSALSVVDNEETLYTRVKEVIFKYKQEALVEEFIEGKELTVGILEKDNKPQVLPILEIDFSNCKHTGEFFYSWKMKEYQGNKELGFVPDFYCPARLDKPIEELIKNISLKTHLALGCKDFSRIDIRLSQDNIPYVLEINPLPGLNPRDSNFPQMAYAAGIKYEDLIETILSNALKRRSEICLTKTV